jgi:lysozyme family protein
MSSFDLAIPIILKHEGGYVNHPKDPGGATNFGISLRFLEKVGDLDNDGWLDGDLDHDGDVDIDDIRAMTETQAKSFYFDHFWDNNQYHLISSQSLATKVFDMTVNMGSRQSHKLLQRTLRAFGRPLNDDGIIGKKSLFAINQTDPYCLLAAYKCQCEGFYRLLVAEKPQTRSDFIDGWLNRVYD